MAWPALAVVEVQSGGSDANGGAFVTGATGTDNTVTNTPVNLTGVTSAGAGNVILSASAAATWVGQIFNVVSGTNFTTTAGAARFECLSVVVGASATFGTNISGASISTGVGANGVINGGGALKLDSANADAILENLQPANKCYIKGGAGPITYTVGSAISISVAGTAAAGRIEYQGYAVTRGDFPSIASNTQPILNMAGNGITFGALHLIRNITVNFANAIICFSAGVSSLALDCKMFNASTTAGRSACSLSNMATFYRCEVASRVGRAFSFGSTNVSSVMYCTIRDSETGIFESSTSASQNYIGNIFYNIQTVCIDIGGIKTATTIINDNTFYGAENKLGIGIRMLSGATGMHIRNNSFYGLVSGVEHADATNVIIEDYNNFYNCTTPRTNVATGSNSTAVDPGYTGFNQRTGATATTGASNILTQSGATFQTWGVVAGDTIYIVSGTGVTAGLYTIQSVDSETQLTMTTTLSANATADKVWQITTVGSLAVGVNLQDLGTPRAMPGKFSGTTNYKAIGAVQSDRAAYFTDIDLAKVDSTYSWKYNTIGANNRTGTYVFTANTNVKTGVAFGVADTGVYTGIERYTDLDLSKVLDTYSWKYNTTGADNRTGTNSGGGGGGAVWVPRR